MSQNNSRNSSNRGGAPSSQRQNTRRNSESKHSHRSDDPNRRGLPVGKSGKSRSAHSVETEQRKSHGNHRKGFNKDRSTSAPQTRGRGGTRGNGRSDRGGAARNYTEAERLQHSLRPVRDAHQDPELPTWVRANELPAAARNEIKRLQPAVQDIVARHLVMAAFLIDENPELAHQHALSAVRRAGRIPVTRETLAMTAYRTGDFGLALRELRTYRRLNGREDHIALMVDCERGLGRPERGIEIGLSADTKQLSTEQRVYLAIAMSGARLDLGQTRQALFELEIPELQDKRVHVWTAELFRAYATVLEDLQQAESAERWLQLAAAAENALETKLGGFDELEVHEIEEHEEELAAAEQDSSAPEVESVTSKDTALAEAQQVVPTSPNIQQEATEGAADKESENN